METVMNSGNASCHKVVWDWHGYEAHIADRSVCVESSLKGLHIIRPVYIRAIVDRKYAVALKLIQSLFYWNFQRKYKKTLDK